MGLREALFRKLGRSIGPAQSAEEVLARGKRLGMETPAYRGIRGEWKDGYNRRVWDLAEKKPKMESGGEFWTNDEDVARSYATSWDEVHEGLLNTKNAPVIDANGADWSEIPVSALPPELRKHFGNQATVAMDQVEVVSKRAGIPVVELRNVIDGYNGGHKPSTVWIMHDRTRRRSTDAKFDPRKAGSTDFYAGLAGLGASSLALREALRRRMEDGEA